MARASLAARTRRLNAAIRMLQEQQPFNAVLSALMEEWGISRRQAYRDLSQAKNHLRPLPVPPAKAIFTVNLPRPLIQAVRARCRKKRQAISHVLAGVLQHWLAQSSFDG